MIALARRLGGRLFDQPYILLTITPALWGGNIVLGRFIRGEIPPITLAWIRWISAFLIVLPFAWQHIRRDWPLIRAQWLLVTVISLTGITAYNTMSYIGLNHTEALNALVVQSTGPLLIGLWMFALYGERLSSRQLVGIFISLAGVLAIVARGEIDRLVALEPNIGDVWFLTALLLYGLYSALLQRRPRAHWLGFLAITMGWGGFLLTPFFLWEVAQGARMSVTPESIAVLAYVALLPSIVAYICFNRGVELVGANRAGPFFHLIPVFGAIFAIAFLGERPQIYHAVGFALVLAGVFIATRK